MFDIDIPWSVVLLMAPILLPWLSIPGALLCGWLGFRRHKNVFWALLALVVGAFGVPWAFLLGLLLLETLEGRAQRLSALGLGALFGLGCLAIVGLVLWGVNRAGTRAR